MSNIPFSQLPPLLPQHPQADQIFRLPEVKLTTGKGKSQIYADVKTGLFPPPIPLGGRSVGWRASAIFQWIAEREEAAERAATAASTKATAMVKAKAAKRLKTTNSTR